MNQDDIFLYMCKTDPKFMKRCIKKKVKKQEIAEFVKLMLQNFIKKNRSLNK